MYLAASRITETDYQSGLRGKHPIQLTVALREAVDGGLIFFQNRSGGIMTVDTVPPEYIVSVENTESQSTLWTRVSAVGLPEAAPADGGESRAAITGEPRPTAKAMPVSLTATSKAAPASKAAPSTLQAKLSPDFQFSESSSLRGPASLALSAQSATTSRRASICVWCLQAAVET